LHGEQWFFISLNTSVSWSTNRASALDFHRFSRLRLEDFHFGMTRADLFFEPTARIFLAMAEQNGARLGLPHKIQQLLPLRVRREIRFPHFTIALLTAILALMRTTRRRPSANCWT
jgi:hypothetical protein